MKHLAGLFMGPQEHSFLYAVPRQYFRPWPVSLTWSPFPWSRFSLWTDGVSVTERLHSTKSLAVLATCKGTRD